MIEAGFFGEGGSGFSSGVRAGAKRRRELGEVLSNWPMAQVFGSYSETLPRLSRSAGMANKKRKRRRSVKPKQLELDFSEKTWGGFRPGAGAKKMPKGEAGVNHGKREELKKGESVQVTWKLREGLPSLRQIDEDHVLRGVFRDAQKEGFRIVHYVVMSNHLHLLVEATDAEALSRGMTGLGTRIARALNRLWKRVGSVIADRYHALVLRGPRMVRNAIHYVLANAFRHGVAGMRGVPDRFSSAEYFDGWRDCEPIEIWGGSPVVPPRTYNLAVGWRKVGGMFSLHDCPGGRTRRRACAG